MTSTTRPRIAAPLLLALLVACPQAQPTPTPAPAGNHPGPDDPRVVADTGDLYAAESRPTAAAEAVAPPVTSPGTGRPDETNGVCRLYAPELPDPTCCDHTFGFDIKATTATCDLPIYLGESFHNTCGFHFVREPNSPPQWFRISTIRGDTPKQAADENLLLLRRTDPTATVEPVPGVPGAFWSKQNEYRWAFIPGWKTVRAVAWKATGCSDEAAPALLRGIIAAPETVTGPRRDGLLPSAAPVPAP